MDEQGRPRELCARAGKTAEPTPRANGQAPEAGADPLDELDDGAEDDAADKLGEPDIPTSRTRPGRRGERGAAGADDSSTRDLSR